MKRSTKNLLWIGGVALGALAIGAGIAYAASKPVAALPSAPPPATGTVTLNVVAGASNAQIAVGQTLNLQLPVGATMTSLLVDGAVQQIPLGQSLMSVYGSNLGQGVHILTVAWSNLTNLPQISIITLSVTA